MQLKLHRSMWSAPTDPDTLFAQTVAAGFDGIEGPIPTTPDARRDFKARLDHHGLTFIAESTTGTPGNPAPGSLASVTSGGGGDWWVPRPDASIDDHLADLRWTAEHARDMDAAFITTMAGYDAWPIAQAVDFFGRALDLEARCGLPIAFETHRTRCLYNPWVTRDILRQLPTLKITCDFSHWCVVCERLIDSELPIIELVAEHAWHIHCRVGYAQHAQVADPRDPAYAKALAAHERWWSLLWAAQRRRGLDPITMTPEFGAEGYMQTLPFTGQPVADLWEVTCWIADRQRERFAAWGEQH